MITTTYHQPLLDSVAPSQTSTELASKEKITLFKRIKSVFTKALMYFPNLYKEQQLAQETKLTLRSNTAMNAKLSKTYALIYRNDNTFTYNNKSSDSSQEKRKIRFSELSEEKPENEITKVSTKLEGNKSLLIAAVATKTLDRKSMGDWLVPETNYQPIATNPIAAAPYVKLKGGREGWGNQ